MTKLSDLSHEEDLLFYDGPLLSLYRDSDKNGYLVYWVDYNSESNTWLLAKPNQGLLDHFQCGSVDLLNTMLSSSELVLFDQDVKNMSFNERVVSLGELGDYMPNPGVFV